MWQELKPAIEFQRDVYQRALPELARVLPRGAHHTRDLRAGMRPHHRDDGLLQHDEPQHPAESVPGLPIAGKASD